MEKLTTLNPNDDGANNANSSNNISEKLKFNEMKLYEGFLHQFYTMGVLTEAEHGTVIATIRHRGRSSTK